MSCNEVIGSSLERRRFTRRLASVVGSAVALDGSRSVVLEDVSRSGARLRGRNLPRKGAELLIRLEGRVLFGSVAWTTFDRRGIQFEEVLERDLCVAPAR